MKDYQRGKLSHNLVLLTELMYTKTDTVRLAELVQVGQHGRAVSYRSIKLLHFRACKDFANLTGHVTLDFLPARH